MKQIKNTKELIKRQIQINLPYEQIQWKPNISCLIESVSIYCGDDLIDYQNYKRERELDKLVFELVKSNHKEKVKNFVENRSARIIQRNCYNWLHSVKCNDGMYGINFKISLNKLNDSGLRLTDFSI